MSAVGNAWPASSAKARSAEAKRAPNVATSATASARPRRAGRTRDGTRAVASADVPRTVAASPAGAA
jgi:hypothetical protein